MGRKQFVKAILFLFGFVPLFVTGQNYPRFELYQLKQGTDSGQFIVTGLDSNLAFNNILRFRSADSTFLIGTDTVAVKSDIASSLLLYVDRVELGDSLDLYPNRTELGDTASAIRADMPSLSGVVLTTTDQSISGVKSFQDDVSIDGALDIAYIGNTYLGNYAGYGIRQDLTTARNVIIGTEAYFTENYANDNVVIGYFAGRNTEYGSNVIIGSKANYFTSPSYVIASNAVVIGANAKTVTSQNDNSIVIGSNATGLGDDTAVIGDGQMTKLNSNKYTFNVDQDTTGKNGYLLGLNSSSGEIELQDISGSYINRTELSDTALAIRTDIPLIINDSLTARNFLTEEVDGSVTNELQTLSKLGLDITLSDGGGTVRDSILTEAQVDNYVSNNGYLTSEIDGSVTNELQTISTSGAAGNITLSNGGGTLNLNVNDADASTTNEIQNISTTGAAGNISISSGSTLTLNVNDADASISNEGSLTVGAGTASTSVISSNTSGSTDVTLTAGTNITLSESGNNITIAASGGGSSLWSEGATTGEIYYNSGNVGIGLTDPEYPLHVSGRGYFTDDLRAFDRIYLGGDFNHTSGSYAPYIDRYAATGETGMDFYAYNSGANLPLFRFFDSYDSYSEVFRLNSAASTYQIIANGDSDFNGDFNLDGRLDVNGFADFNSDQNASHDFGVGSLNYYPFMWVDASADQMAVGGGTPQYTLDVTGDINFTNKLYQNGVEVTFGGTTINNNADNRIITGSNTANTLEGESNLTYDGTTLTLLTPMNLNYPVIQLKNASSTNGTIFYLYNTQDFTIRNFESGYMQFLSSNGNYLRLKSNGNIEISDLAGVSDVGADANGVLQAATSDTTLKTNILPNKYGLKKVMDLETIKFNWKDKDSKGYQKEVGFNAQNLQKVIPEATYIIPSNGKLGIKDDAIIATLTKAIQEQQEMIEELQKEIKRIKRKIK